jgi:hypothetical protein
MSGIFISYRREDSAPYAGRLHDRLSAHFGATRVFMDVDDIPPGADFSAHIRTKVASCDALIAIIGKEWLAARSPAGHSRLNDPADIVALELASALQRKILVVPVLVGGAAMPKPEELREDLRELARKNAVILHDHDFQRDVEVLIKSLEEIPALRKKADTPEQAAFKKRRERLIKRLWWKAPLIFLLVSFAVWWQSRHEESAKLGSQAVTPEISEMAQAVSGVWQGEVNYTWGKKYVEQFFFQPEGNRLYGTASFLGHKRGIENGRIEADGLSFDIRYEEVLGDIATSRMNRYRGKLAGDEIRVQVQDDKGGTPVEFAMTRKGDSPQ